MDQFGWQKRTRGHGLFRLFLVVVIGALVAACADVDPDEAPDPVDPAAEAEGDEAPDEAAPDDDDPEGEDEEGDGDDRLAMVRERDELIIGVKYDTPPYGWLNPETGEPEGFDVDMAREITAEILGDTDKIDLREAGTDNRIPLLTQGDLDLALATMTITEERLEEIDFSIPYYPSGMGIAVDPDSPIESPADLEGTTNCITPGSVSHELIVEALEEDYGFSDLEVIELPSYPECVQAMRTGRADFVGTDHAILIGLEQELGDLRVLPDILDDGPWGVGVAKGNAELVEAVNDAIEATFDSGRWAELYEEWTGLEAPEDFPERARAER